MMSVGTTELILVASFILGIILVLSDGMLKNTDKVLWMLGIIVFNVFALIAYLLYRFFFRKEPNTYSK